MTIQENAFIAVVFDNCCKSVQIKIGEPVAKFDISMHSFPFLRNQSFSNLLFVDMEQWQQDGTIYPVSLDIAMANLFMVVILDRFDATTAEILVLFDMSIITYILTTHDSNTKQAFYENLFLNSS